MNISSDEYANMTLEEMEMLSDKLAMDKVNIKGQLDQARVEFYDSGERSDPAWYARTNYALRMKSQQCMILQREAAKKRKGKNIKQSSEIAISKKKIKQARAITFERLFVDIAKRLLDEDTFCHIRDEAIEEASL